MCAKDTPYVEEVYFFPADTTVQMPDLRIMTWKEVFREIEETRYYGRHFTLPQVRDENGKPLVYTPQD